MTVSAPDDHRDERAAHAPVRVLRWTFRRADDAVVFELGLDRRESAYELKVNAPWTPAERYVEVFRDAIAALMRQAAIERTLVDEGWSLERFESHQTVEVE